MSKERESWKECRRWREASNRWLWRPHCSLVCLLWVWDLGTEGHSRKNAVIVTGHQKPRLLGRLGVIWVFLWVIRLSSKEQNKFLFSMYFLYARHYSKHVICIHSERHRVVKSIARGHTARKQWSQWRLRFIALHSKRTLFSTFSLTSKNETCSDFFRCFCLRICIKRKACTLWKGKRA